MNEQILVQFRVDKKLKQEVTEIYETLGMDLPTALRMFMSMSRLTKGIPFDVALPKGVPPVCENSISSGAWTPIGNTGLINISDKSINVGRDANVKAVTGDITWSDYTCEATLTLTGEGSEVFGEYENAGIIFRTTEAKDGVNRLKGYYFGFGSTDKKGVLVRGHFDGNDWIPDNRVVLDSPFLNGEAHQLKVVCFGNYAALYFDGALFECFTADEFPTGQIGLRSWNRAFAASDVCVRPVSTDDLVDITAIRGV